MVIKKYNILTLEKVRKLIGTSWKLWIFDYHWNVYNKFEYVLPSFVKEEPVRSQKWATGPS